jgi:hypothetical protein
VTVSEAKGEISIPVEGEVSDGGVPASLPGFSFGPARPNPFTASTEIPYTIAQAGLVTITIRGSGNRLIRTLSAENRPAGSHLILWDGRDEQGDPVPAGLYTARIEAGDNSCRGDIEVVR